MGPRRVRWRVSVSVSVCVRVCMHASASGTASGVLCVQAQYVCVHVLHGVLRLGCQELHASGCGRQCGATPRRGLWAQRRHMVPVPQQCQCQPCVQARLVNCQCCDHKHKMLLNTQPAHLSCHWLPPAAPMTPMVPPQTTTLVSSHATLSAHTPACHNTWRDTTQPVPCH